MARLEELQYRLLLPVAAGVALIFALLLVGVRGVGALVTFGLAGFVLAVTLERVLSDVRKRHDSTNEGWLIASRRLFRAAPRRYGGYLVHLGVLLIVVGIAASQEYGARATATLYPGQSMSVAGYILTYRGLDPRQESNRMVLGARISASRDGHPLGTLTPSQNYYPTLQQPVVTPAVNEQPWDMVYGLLQGRNPLPALAPILRGQNPFEDLYLVLQAVDTGNASQHRVNRWVTLQVLVNPMVDFIWMGGFVMGLGGLFALLPVRRRRALSALIPEPVALQPEEVTA
jgi:cytochrome c-type biogenesis protein CcmF